MSKRHGRRKLCARCGQRQPVFKRKILKGLPMGRAVARDKDHDICPRCFDSLASRNKARKLAENEAGRKTQG